MPENTLPIITLSTSDSRIITEVSMGLISSNFTVFTSSNGLDFFTVRVSLFTEDFTVREFKHTEVFTVELPVTYHWINYPENSL